MIAAIGRYTLLARIGGGGMADVYRATGPGGQPVALRTVAKAAPGAEARLQAERDGAAILRLLTAGPSPCPAIPRLFETFETEDAFCLAMEFVEGEDLSDRLARGPLSEAEALHIAIQICQGLTCAHECHLSHPDTPVHGACHGDIKPHNIRLGPHGEVKILDWGIAKGLTEGHPTHQFFASPPYSSPERALEKRFDRHCDLWAVGVLLYEMITCERPFPVHTLDELRALYTASTFPRRLTAGSLPLQSVIMRCLAYDLAKRYPTVRDLAADLTRIAHGELPAGVAVFTSSATLLESAANRTLLETETAPVLPVRPAPRPTPHSPNAPLPPAAPSPFAFFTTPRGHLALVLALATLTFLIAAYQARNQLLVHREAETLADRLAPISDVPESAWTAYTELRDRSLGGFAVWNLRRTIATRYQETADLAFRRYREGSNAILSRPTTLRLQTILDRLEDLQGSTPALRSRQLLLQAATRKDFREAIALLEQAAKADPAAAEPLLLAARIEAYNLQDSIEAARFLHEAQVRHFTLGDREKSILADGRRIDAAARWMQYRRTSCADISAAKIADVRQLLDESLSLYAEIPGYLYTARNIEACRKLLVEIERSCNPVAAPGPTAALNPAP